MGDRNEAVGDSAVDHRNSALAGPDSVRNMFRNQALSSRNCNEQLLTCNLF
jgi:hypothetical protein